MKLVIVGDSIAAGLGVAGHSYADLLARQLSATLNESVDLQNLAKSASQIDESRTRISAVVDMKPDVLILAHGISEALLRPVPRAMRFVPGRWREAGWLDPRPYFSSRLLKGLYQRTESAIRWRVKVALMRCFGSAKWMTDDSFKLHLGGYIDEILSRSTAQVVVLSSSSVDNARYPGSSQTLATLRTLSADVVQERASSKRVIFVDIGTLLNEWGDYFHDRFHPNAGGHAKIANHLLPIVASLPR